MSRRPRRNHTAAFKAKVALAAVKGELCKGVAGSERPGHKYRVRKVKAGGGYKYEYHAPEMTNAKHVIRMGSLTEEKYLQRDNTWGDYKTAKRFKNQDAANEHGQKHVTPAHGQNWGTFAISVPHYKPSK